MDMEVDMDMKGTLTLSEFWESELSAIIDIRESRNPPPFKGT
jgi:hypothetical protein